VGLPEHGELRETLKLSSVPDYTTLYRFVQRLEDETINRVLGEAARRSKSPKRQARRRARVAVDSTGLSHSAASSFFIRRIQQRPDDALELLVEVADRHRSGQTDHFGAARAAGTVVRVPKSAGFGRCGERRHADPFGAGGRYNLYRLRHRLFR
jgi:hypothetical protein